jgi:hypothetical protein
MKKKSYLILLAVILYTGVFLCHDAIFIEKDSFHFTPKTLILLLKSDVSSDSSAKYIATHHKCPFCDGFINDANIQEIIRVDLVKLKIREIYFPSIITSLLLGNPTRAPPSI